MERLFISRQSRHFDFDVVICKVLFPIYCSTWRVNIYVSRQGEGINKRNEITDREPIELLLALCSTDDINQYYNFHYKKTVRRQFDFSSENTINYYSLTITFPGE